MKDKWRKIELVVPDTILRDDDWSLLDQKGDSIAQLFNTGADDLIGAWRWRIWMITRCKKVQPIAAQKRGRLVKGYWLNFSRLRWRSNKNKSRQWEG